MRRHHSTTKLCHQPFVFLFLAGLALVLTWIALCSFGFYCGLLFCLGIFVRLSQSHPNFPRLALSWLYPCLGPLNLELTDSSGFDAASPSILLLLSPQNWIYCYVCLLFFVGTEDQTQTLTLVWQTLHWLSLTQPIVEIYMSQIKSSFFNLLLSGVRWQGQERSLIPRLTSYYQG